MPTPPHLDHAISDPAVHAVARRAIAALLAGCDDCVEVLVSSDLEPAQRTHLASVADRLSVIALALTQPKETIPSAREVLPPPAPSMVSFDMDPL